MRQACGQACQQNGFVLAGAVVTDIGGGFVTDDFVITKDLD
jgi:hypothetical protein